MNVHTTERKMEIRNLLFTFGGVVIVLLFLSVVIERKSLAVKPPVMDTLHLAEKPRITAEPPVIPKTRVKIQPLMVRFPPLPDFSAFRQIDQRKAAFIDYMTPIVEYQNDKILMDRNYLEQIAQLIVSGEPLSFQQQKWLEQLAEKYDVEWEDGNPGAVVVKLARRVDIVPLSLALVQAAKESSWGRSRYAVQANNLFGQWCFNEGCGIVPAERDSDAGHEVKRFKTVNEATRSYIHNLNTHAQYADLRQIRQKLRIYRKPITGPALADGLLYYSERRQAYVEEVKSMIHQYRIFQERREG